MPMDSEQTAATAEPGEHPTDAGPPRHVVVFWRPGCGFCSSLRRGLRDLDLPLAEVDIWEDERAAAAVRAITGGDETVPTVVVGDAAMVNPTAQQVLEAVREHAPHLLDR